MTPLSTGRRWCKLWTKRVGNRTRGIVPTAKEALVRHTYCSLKLHTIWTTPLANGALYMYNSNTIRSFSMKLLTNSACTKTLRSYNQSPISVNCIYFERCTARVRSRRPVGIINRCTECHFGCRFIAVSDS